MWEPSPEQLLQVEQVEREERDARLNLEAARKQTSTDDGVVPREHHELIRKLEAEWEHARERLHRVRKASPD